MISTTSYSPGATVVTHPPHHHLPTTSSSIGEKCIPLHQQTTLVGADQLKRKRSKKTCRPSLATNTISRPSLATSTISMDTPADTPAVSDNGNDTDSTNDSETIPPKRRKISCSNDSTTSRNKRVSFSNGPQSIVEVDTVLSDKDKQNVWYKTEDYTQFITSAHFDAQRLRNAAQCATSSEALYMFIQSSDLSPRGLEKVLQYASCSSSDEEEESSDDDSSSSYNGGKRSNGFQVNRHSRRVRLLKSQHREIILSMHRNQKELGAHKPEELRKFSEDSSRWAVETALKLGHIDAQGLL